MDNKKQLEEWIAYYSSRGPEIDQGVIEAAHKLLSIATAYSQGKPDEAVELLARISYNVSKFVLRDGPPAVDIKGREIRDMKDYLYRGYMKKANYFFHNSKKQVPLVELERGMDFSDNGSAKRILEETTLFEELFRLMDPKLQAIFTWREIERCSWTHVGKVVGMSSDAAKVYYSRGIQRLAKQVYEQGNVVRIDRVRK